MSAERDPMAWLEKADDDLLSSSNNIAAARTPWDTVGFHSQQAVEKILKGFLASHDRPIPHIHDLVALITHCEAISPSLAALRGDCARLSGYAVLARYPDDTGHRATETEGRWAHATAVRVRELVVPLFGDAR